MSRHSITITISNKHITNLLVNSIFGQLNTPPVITDISEVSDTGEQYITYKLQCTYKEELIIKTSLSDYIFKPVTTNWIWL